MPIHSCNLYDPLELTGDEPWADQFAEAHSGEHSLTTGDYRVFWDNESETWAFALRIEGGWDVRERGLRTSDDAYEAVLEHDGASNAAGERRINPKWDC